MSATMIKGGPSISDSYDAGLQAAWELDLWGGNRAALASARASAAADRFDRDGAAGHRRGGGL